MEVATTAVMAEEHTVGSDALKDLREWQRRHASAQERALRSAIKARSRVDQLDEQRAAATADLVDALEALATAGVSREQAAALLGTTVSALPPRSAARSRATEAEPSDGVGRRSGESTGSSGAQS